MTTPAVSVVMPVRDAAATLPAAIESLLAQSDPHWELVAVDDGSTDGSPALLEGHTRVDSRIRCIVSPSPGLVAALNAGVAAARAPLIARLDADDRCLPERLDRQRRHLTASPELGLVGCRVRFGGDPVRAAGFARYVEWSNTLIDHDTMALYRFVESPLVHPSVMFRRKLVERIGGYRDGPFPEDYELWLRWLEAGVRMAKLPETLLVWNDSPGRLSRRDARYAAGAFYSIKAEYLARWLAARNPHHPRVVLWGAGRVTRQRMRALLARGIQVEAWVDVHPGKIGRLIAGQRVLSPAELPPPGACFVVSCVGSRHARDRIEHALRAGGHVPGVHYLMAA